MNGGDRFRLNQMKQTASDEAVPLYRTYGVKRRLRPWQEKINLTFGRIVLIWMLGILGFAACACIVGFWLYFPELWVKVLLSLLIVAVLAIRMTRTLRKRLKFMRKLKRLCKRKKYRLTPVQNFFQSLFWSGNREDFVLETGRCVYFVRFLTVRKYRSTLYFEKPDAIKLVTRPLNNKFTLIFDVQPRVRYYPMDFTVDERICGLWKNKKQIKALLINPVSSEMLYRKRDGGYESTGNGGAHYGYTVFTGSGFLETVLRNDETVQPTAQH
jgi:hypothetical protein